MKKKKWNTLGFEEDTRYSNFCKKKLNLKIHTKNLESIKSKHDLITFNKVLEHIVNPVNFLSRFKNIQLPLNYKKERSQFIIINNFNKKSVKIGIRKIIKKII